jgi:glycosyltransferase involved in cell wall biosynthesis
MNLCFINPTEVPKPEIYGVATHLPKTHNITILQPATCSKINHIVFQENIHITQIPSTFLTVCQSKITLSPLNLWVKELSREIENKMCDVIHVCNYDYITALPPIFMNYKFSVPIVITNDALMGTGSYSFGSSLVDLLLSTYTHSIGNKVLKQYNKVVLLYTQLQKDAIKLGISEEKIEVIPNGIDIEWINSYQQNINKALIKKKYGISEDEKVVLYVGRLVKMKRAEIVCNLVEQLLSQGLKVKALIVGDGPYRAELESCSEKIRKNVIFTGFLAKEKYECYEIADLFVLPSISEGLPTVLLEAAAFGVPAIATNSNGIPDIIDHEKTGFLVDNWSSIRYVDFAHKVLTDESFAKELGCLAKKRVEHFFQWTNITRRYEELYKDLINA